jgi:hypothetical protein
MEGSLHTGSDRGSRQQERHDRAHRQTRDRRAACENRSQPGSVHHRPRWGGRFHAPSKSRTRRAAPSPQRTISWLFRSPALADSSDWGTDVRPAMSRTKARRAKHSWAWRRPSFNPSFSPERSPCMRQLQACSPQLSRSPPIPSRGHERNEGVSFSPTR